MNNSKSDTLSQRSLDKRKAKRWAVVWTVIYLMLMPVLFMFALFSFMIFDNPRMTLPIGFSVIFTFFWTPLSMAIAIYSIWKSYSRSQYSQMYGYCALPFFIFFAFWNVAGYLLCFID
jgi:hypothetical protein